jgi:hypothetical protein
MASENDRPAMGEAEDARNAARNAQGDDATRDEMSPEELKAEVERIRAEKEQTAAALKKANEEAKKSRLRLADLERAEEERSQAKLTDEERARRANAEREQKFREAEDRATRVEALLQSERVDRAVERHAIEAGFLYPSDVPKLIDRDRITIDDDGRPAGIKEAVDRLAKDRPGLLGASRGGGSPQAMRARLANGTEAAARTIQRNVDPYEQELLEMGRGGRM